MKNYLIKGTLSGIISGVIASLCCLGPTIIALLGLGAIFGITGLCLTPYKIHFFTLGLLFLLISNFFYLRKNKYVCDMNSREKAKYLVWVFTIMIIVYLIILQLLLPSLHSFNSNAICSLR